jgi:hypothetical protein
VTDQARATTPWTKVAAVCAMAGGAMWLVKQVVIAASASGGPPPENPVIAAAYLAGLALMLVGASGPAARLLAGARPFVWIPVAVLSAPVLFFGVQFAADGLFDAAAGPGAHWWWESEGAIVLTAVVFLAIGGVLLAEQRRGRNHRQAATVS